MEKITREFLDNLIEKEDMVLLYFGNHTCSVCVDLEPKIKELLKKYPKLVYQYIGIEDNIKLTREYSIFTIPGILVYAGGKEVVREARYISVQDIDSKIGRYYGMLFD